MHSWPARVAASVIVPLAIAIRMLTAEPCAPAVSFVAMSDCIFCGIAAGTMPAERVYSDERTVAFLDLFPARRRACARHPARARRRHPLCRSGRRLAACAQTAQLMAGARQRRARQRRRHGHAVQRRRRRADRLPLPRARHPALRRRRRPAALDAGPRERRRSWRAWERSCAGNDAFDFSRVPRSPPSGRHGIVGERDHAREASRPGAPRPRSTRRPRDPARRSIQTAFMPSALAGT